MIQEPHKGFTLVETMVAVTILAFALVGPFAAVQTALTNSYVARDQLTASSLAQEAQEYIRSIRDNNYLASPQRTWLDGFNTVTNGRSNCYGTGSSPTGFCTIDATLGDFHSETSSIKPMVGYSASQINSIPYLYRSSAGLYNQQNSGTATRFKRTVQIEEISSIEIRVTVVVTWITSGKTYSITVVNNYFDWL